MVLREGFGVMSGDRYRDSGEKLENRAHRAEERLEARNGPTDYIFRSEHQATQRSPT